MLKKLIFGFIVIGLLGIMIFTLFHNKAESDRKATSVKKLHFVPVSTLTMHRQEFKTTFSKTGSIIAQNEVSIVSQCSGRVIAVYANVGSYVRAGAYIAKVKDDVLGSKLAAARTAYEVACHEWARAQTLHQEKIISDADLEIYLEKLQTSKTEYASAQDDYNNSLISAPFAGVITERMINLGATVSPGSQIATMIDNSAYKIVVNVGEQEAFQLSPGNTVSIITGVYPGEKLSGCIKSISSKSDEVHTFPVEIIIQDSKTHPLKSGIFGKVIFDSESVANVLAIPREALIGSIKNPQVYVVVNGRAIIRNIVIDTEVGSYLVVKQGLVENEAVVVSGQENLRNNVAVKVINQEK
jgi:RND family efflux transporter MFP subunit